MHAEVGSAHLLVSPDAIAPLQANGVASTQWAEAAHRVALANVAAGVVVGVVVASVPAIVGDNWVAGAHGPMDRPESMGSPELVISGM